MSLVSKYVLVGSKNFVEVVSCYFYPFVASRLTPFRPYKMLTWFSLFASRLLAVAISFESDRSFFRCLFQLKKLKIQDKVNINQNS